MHFKGLHACSREIVHIKTTGFAMRPSTQRLTLTKYEHSTAAYIHKPLTGSHKIDFSNCRAVIKRGKDFKLIIGV